MLCVCDHFEPLHDSDHEGALRRIDEWQSRWPSMVNEFTSVAADGVGPRHTFFYPVEQYHPELMDRLAEVCRDSGAEVELHLHHDNDTAENLERSLIEGVDALAGHGFLCRDKGDGSTRYSFIHGNWALDDSDPAGRNCGVRGELGILRRTGCYADFTMPSAPHPTQTRIINSIYYARDGMDGKSHDSGLLAACGDDTTGALRDSEEHLLLAQGPLGLNWRWRKWGVVPKVENAELTGVNPPTTQRLQLWADLAPSVAGRPDWLFVKLHTHGGIPQNYETLLGDPMRRYFEGLRNVSEQGLQVHFVSAREMVNMVHAAEDGCHGDPGDYRDYRFELRTGTSDLPMRLRR